VAAGQLLEQGIGNASLLPFEVTQQPGKATSMHRGSSSVRSRDVILTCRAGSFLSASKHFQVLSVYIHQPNRGTVSDAAAKALRRAYSSVVTHSRFGYR